MLSLKCIQVVSTPRESKGFKFQGVKVISSSSFSNLLTCLAAKDKFEGMSLVDASELMIRARQCVLEVRQEALARSLVSGLPTTDPSLPPSRAKCFVEAQHLFG